jgi:membrane-associated phospholipid phosphatase
MLNNKPEGDATQRRCRRRHSCPMELAALTSFIRMTHTSQGAPESWPRSWRARLANLHPRMYLGLHVLAGTIGIVGLTWLFLAIADEIPEGSRLVQVDAFLVRWFEAHGTEPGESILSGVTTLGAPLLYAVVVAAVLWFMWRREWRSALALALAALGGVALSNLLKVVFHRGRPATVVEFIPHPSWSFPSGHALNSVVSYGFLAMLVLDRVTGRRKRIAVVLAATIMVLVIGFSRLYLGVHYLSDVTGGWIAGAAWLLVCISAYRLAPGRPASRTG